MKKRYLSFISAILAILLLTACGTDYTENDSTSSESQSVTESTELRSETDDGEHDNDYDVVIPDTELIPDTDPVESNQASESEDTSESEASSEIQSESDPAQSGSESASQSESASSSDGSEIQSQSSSESASSSETDTESDIEISIQSLPTVDESKCFVGMPLSMVQLSGGKADIEGSFSWADPNTLLTENGKYGLIFTSDNGTLELTEKISVNASYIPVTVSVGSNGSSNISGTKKVSFGESLDIILTPNFGYMLDSVSINGKTISADLNFTIESITEKKNVSVFFKQTENPISITCFGGSDGKYSIDGATLTISGIAADTVYSITGDIYGNIVIDVDPQYKFELELAGCRITSNLATPISIINGDKVTISAKKGYVNSITDARPDTVNGTAPDSFPAAIYSLIDLDVQGKGTLNVSSAYNSGIHTKKDLEIQNLTLSVTCRENAARGNDSVTITSAMTTLIATHGDAVKTSNSDISSKGNQRGNITISGGIHNIYSAGDAISAAHDVNISESSTVLSIYTDSYSKYTKLKADISDDLVYIRSETAGYTYSVRFSNEDGSYAWTNAQLIAEDFIDGKMVYFFAAEKKSGYTQLAVYAYNSDQQQGQNRDFSLTTYNIPTNEGYDTVAVKHLEGALGFRFTNYRLVEHTAKDEIYTVDERSCKGIKASNSITVSAGTINISAHDDAIKANNDSTLENGINPTGNITVNGGQITISTYATAILAEGDLVISGGTVTVNKCYTGISGKTVNTNGSTVTVNAVYKTQK